MEEQIEKYTRNKQLNTSAPGPSPSTYRQFKERHALFTPVQRKNMENIGDNTLKNFNTDSAINRVPPQRTFRPGELYQKIRTNSALNSALNKTKNPYTSAPPPNITYDDDYWNRPTQGGKKSDKISFKKDGKVVTRKVYTRDKKKYVIYKNDEILVSKLKKINI